MILIKKNLLRLPLALLLIGTLIMVNGCAVEKRTVPGVSPPSLPSPAENLLHEADEELQHRRYDKAEILAERALRMEPQNPIIWQLMGRIKHAMNNHSQAVQFYKKSNSMAGKNSELREQNMLYIEEAYRKMGKTKETE